MRASWPPPSGRGLFRHQVAASFAVRSHPLPSAGRRLLLLQAMPHPPFSRGRQRGILLQQWSPPKTLSGSFWSTFAHLFFISRILLCRRWTIVDPEVSSHDFLSLNFAPILDPEASMLEHWFLCVRWVYSVLGVCFYFMFWAKNRLQKLCHEKFMYTYWDGSKIKTFKVKKKEISYLVVEVLLSLNYIRVQLLLVFQFKFCILFSTSTLMCRTSRKSWNYMCTLCLFLMLTSILHSYCYA